MQCCSPWFEVEEDAERKHLPQETLFEAFSNFQIALLMKILPLPFKKCVGVNNIVTTMQCIFFLCWFNLTSCYKDTMSFNYEFHIFNC